MPKITKLSEKLIPRHPCTAALFADANLDEHRRPLQEFCYVRSDHDGHQWWGTFWPCHKSFETHALVQELDSVYDAFKRSFHDRIAMASWCYRYAAQDSDDEFSAYYVGEYGFYWFRMISRRGDYNLYLHCYSKEAMIKDNILKEEISNDAPGSF